MIPEFVKLAWFQSSLHSSQPRCRTGTFVYVYFAVSIFCGLLLYHCCTASNETEWETIVQMQKEKHDQNLISHIWVVRGRYVIWDTRDTVFLPGTKKSDAIPSPYSIFIFISQIWHDADTKQIYVWITRNWFQTNATRMQLELIRFFWNMFAKCPSSQSYVYPPLTKKTLMRWQVQAITSNQKNYLFGMISITRKSCTAVIPCESFYQANSLMCCSFVRWCAILMNGCQPQNCVNKWEIIFGARMFLILFLMIKFFK